MPKLTIANHSEVLEIEEEKNLSEALDAKNSPILFGCRTGICGTCLIEVQGPNKLVPADEDEKELLDIVASGNQNARLACQISLNCDLKVKYLGKNE